MYWADGQIYTGEFKGGKRNGLGTMYYNDGSKWIGDWIKDKKNGQGTEYAPSGEILRVGKWKDNKYSQIK